MPDGYEVHDGRFIQYKSATSGANGHFVTIGPVPANKIWTILSGIGYPSVDETQDYWFAIYKSGVGNFVVTKPAQHVFDVSEENHLPLLQEGMELKLFPGEYVMFSRDGNTVGSTITLFIRYLETDLPFYRYSEPLKPVVDTTKKHGSAFRGVGGGGGGSTGGGIIGGGHPTGGGGGGALPV